MPRIVSEEEFDVIEQVIFEHPEGVVISALEKILSVQLKNINRRTLQRRLKQLKEKNRITTCDLNFWKLAAHLLKNALQEHSQEESLTDC